MRRAQIVMLTLAAFVLGALAGGVGMRTYERANFFPSGGPGHPPLEEMLKKYFASELSLDEAQRKAVNAILDQTRKDTWAIQRKVKPEMDARLEATGQAIRAVLRPDQLPRFEEMEAERRAHMEKRDRE